MIRVNLGCGEYRAPGWVDLDITTSCDVSGDVRALPFATRRVDAIYAGHVIEHVAQADLPTVASELARVIKPLRPIVVTFPDMDRMDPSDPFYERALRGDWRWPGDEHRYRPTTKAVCSGLQGPLIVHPVELSAIGPTWPLASLAPWQGAVVAQAASVVVKVPTVAAVAPLPVLATPYTMTDDEAYWRYWRDLWRAKRSVVNVEHDIHPSRGALFDLVDCPEPWCAQPYAYLGSERFTGLGCTKVMPALMDAMPDLWEQVATMSDGRHPSRHWCRLDAWMRTVAGDHGYRVHEHAVPVTHDSRRSSHGCA